MKYVGIDIGNTMIKYALISSELKIQFFNSIETPDNLDDFWMIMDNIYRQIKQCNSNIHMIGISCPGQSHDISAKVGGRIKYLYDMNMKEEFEEKFDLETHILNDGKCAGLAEYKVGSAIGRESAVIITIGTAIAGAVFSNNALILGSSLNAGEFSWYRVRDSDGQVKLLYKVSSISAICKYVKKIKGIDLSGTEIFNKAKNHDSDCQKIIENAAYGIADLIANLQCLIDPSVFCIGGFLCSEDFFINLINLRLDSIWKSHKTNIKKPEVIAGALKGAAGVIGAVINCQDKEQCNHE